MKKFCAVIITIITAITNCCVGFASPFGDKLENGISTYAKQIDMSKYKYSQEEVQKAAALAQPKMTLIMKELVEQF